LLPSILAGPGARLHLTGGFGADRGSCGGRCGRPVGAVVVGEGEVVEGERVAKCGLSHVQLVRLMKLVE